MVLGCKVNDYEAHYLKEQMDKDYREVNFNEEADVYIIFTCCVTNTAEAKTRKFIRHVRREHPEAYLCVVGCYVQSKHDDKIFEDVDLLVGSKHKGKIKEYIDRKEKADLFDKFENDRFEDLFVNEYRGKTRAYLKIQDGCNQFCTYCVIPYARGAERSAAFAKIIAQAKILAKNSKEITLTGIHTGRYRDEDHDLYDVLKALCAIDELKTIRLSSIEITEVSDKIAKLVAENDKIAKHLHIPLQAGSDEILKAMHRPYTVSEFKDRIAKLRVMIPGLLVSTDLIVGFPSETDELFMKTKETLRAIGFSFVHVFPYAKKDHTVAATMKEQISADVKKQRVRAIIKMQKEITAKIQENYLDREVFVLAETFEDGFTFGHSKEYLPVYVLGNYVGGTFLKVRITKVKDGRIIGEVMEDVA